MDLTFGNVTILIPPLHITIILVVIIFLLVRWSKQLETRRFTVFFYFLFSTTIIPIYTSKGFFQLWIPIGFIIMFLYLFGGRRHHPAKVKASILGFSIAIYQLILKYVG
ncbi:hypothetical protein N6H13_09245 [Paenibacillus sp. CC-CFT742]|nr:hypothetical protein [Paenibacillus sp. CC-CFT742]WJH30775.1 hypothetical protein N6H13_09245 [Paenibacillus sp. CC-CFT742]